MKKCLSAEKKIFVKDLAINIKLSKCILQSRKWNYIYLEDLGFIYTEKCNVKTMNLLLLLDTIFFYCEESQIIVQCNVIILLMRGKADMIKRATVTWHWGFYLWICWHRKHLVHSFLRMKVFCLKWVMIAIIYFQLVYFSCREKKKWRPWHLNTFTSYFLDLALLCLEISAL